MCSADRPGVAVRCYVLAPITRAWCRDLPVIELMLLVRAGVSVQPSRAGTDQDPPDRLRARHVGDGYRGRRVLANPSVSHPHDAVARVAHLVVVGDEDERLAALPVEATKHREH